MSIGDLTFELNADREIADGWRAGGARVDGYYYCPHHPQGSVAELRQECECRKPRPGQLLKAAKDLSLDLPRSFIVGDRWRDVGGNLPSDFGFPIEVHAHEPETIYVVPITSDSLHYPPDGRLRVYRSRTGGQEWEALTEGLPQRHCYVNVLRDAMAVDTLDPCGIYFGTTGGQVYVSADAGDTWSPIVRDLPSVVSVEVQTLP